MLADIFKSTNLVYFLNKIICFTTKISGVSNHIDEENKVVYNISRQYPERIVNAYVTSIYLRQNVAGQVKGNIEKNM